MAWGGRRKGAGRPAGARVRHQVRPGIPSGKPVQISLRVRNRYPSLRQTKMRRPLDRSVEAARNRFGVRIVRHWIEENRIVLLVEAPTRESLSRAMQGFGIRFAKSVHREMGTRGTVLDERFHLVVLRNRPQVREALGRMLRRTNRRFREELDSLQGLYTTDKALEATDRGPPLVRFALLGLELAAMVATSRASMFSRETMRNAGAMIRQEERAARERKRRWERNANRRYKDRLQKRMADRYRREMQEKARKD